MDPFWKEYHFSGAQLGGRDGGEAPQPFFENQKKKPGFWKKKALIVSILELNLTFKMWF